MIFDLSKTYERGRWNDSVKECFPSLDIFKIDEYLNSQEIGAKHLGQAQGSFSVIDFYHYNECSIRVGKGIISDTHRAVTLSLFSENKDGVKLTFNELEAVLLKDTTVKYFQ